MPGSASSAPGAARIPAVPPGSALRAHSSRRRGIAPPSLAFPHAVFVDSARPPSGIACDIHRSLPQFGAVRLHQVPMCAELIQSLSAAVAGIVVADVVIERVTVISQLSYPIGARRAAQF